VVLDEAGLFASPMLPYLRMIYDAQQN